MDRRNFLGLLMSTPFVGMFLPRLVPMLPSRLEMLRAISFRLNHSVHWVIGKELVWYKMR